MKRAILLTLATALVACGGEVTKRPSTSDSNEVSESSIRAVPFTDVVVDDAFWAPRLERNRRVTIPHIWGQNEITGRVANFERAAGRRAGPYAGRRFNDTDVYKIVEAASYAIDKTPDAELEAELDELIELIGAAQQADGYLFPALTVDPYNPALGVGNERWMHVSVGSHELYNAGHLIEAAVAHHLATGKRSLLDVAIAFADRIEEDFGPDARHDIPGHEEIELALVKLADVTGEVRYLELARFFLDQRGRPHDGALYAADTDFAIYNDATYKQDHLPVAEQTRAAGHAVRATYLYTGMADVAARLDAPEYETALESIWGDIVATKLYLTGSIGARGTFESFGDDYELPNRGYGETCAAIGFEQWNHRMFLATGGVDYLDVMEQTLYNGLLSGVSQAGDGFFYTNVLQSSGEDHRQAYFEVACCPANVARLLAQLPGFIYAQRDNRIWVNHYIGSQARIELPAGSVEIVQQTGYPWDGKVRIEVVVAEDVDFDLSLRIPAWARQRPVPSDLYRFVAGGPNSSSSAEGHGDSVHARINEGDSEAMTSRDGMIHISRTWQSGDVVSLEFPMPVRLVEAHPSIEDTRGKLAIQRGPLVYAVEAVDNNGTLDGLAIARDAELEAEFRSELLGGMTVVSAWTTRPDAAKQEPSGIHAVPYFAWANRGPGEMVVWLPTVD